MARTTQDKFFDQLEAIAFRYKLEIINDQRFSNCGTVRLEKHQEFKPLVTFNYDFQSGGHDGPYASFDQCSPLFGDRNGGTSFPYVKPEELYSRVLSAIEATLDKLVKP